MSIRTGIIYSSVDGQTKKICDRFAEMLREHDHVVEIRLMAAENKQVGLSRFLSLVLRHKPEVIGLSLDPNGWANVQDLVEKASAHGKPIDIETLNSIVENNNKKRFSFNEDRSRIRANQGHSIKIELGYAPTRPPKILYHGTGQKYVENIYSTGIEKRNRHHVHLSMDIDTALSVGKRHGKGVVFEIQAEEMFREGYEFYVSENGVWLTDEIPVKYIKEMG